MMDTESTNQPAVLVARCDNYREDVDAPCTGEIRFRWGMSQSDPCNVCCGRCGIAVADWERVDRAGAVPDTGQAREPDEDAIRAADLCHVAAWVVANPQGAATWLNSVPSLARQHLATWLRTEEVLFRTDAGRGSPIGFPSWHFAQTVGTSEPSGDTVQAPAVADLAYARSEVDKWLADNDPYCILPTRTEHIPALLARLDELEGTR